MLLLSYGNIKWYNRSMETPESGDNLSLHLSNAKHDLTALQRERSEFIERARHVARATLLIVQTQIIDGLPVLDGSLDECDFTQLRPARHMRGVLRAARFADESIIQLTTHHDYEDRMHTLRLKGAAGDVFHSYARESFNITPRKTGSRPFKTDGIDKLVDDPSGLVLLGEVRSLTDVQARDGWPDAFGAEELAGIRHSTDAA